MGHKPNRRLDDEALAWIERHGSEHLKRCIAEEVECWKRYGSERVDRAAHGWLTEWDFRDEIEAEGGRIEPAVNPPEEVWTALDVAREEMPGANLASVYAGREAAVRYVARSTYHGIPVVRELGVER